MAFGKKNVLSTDPLDYSLGLIGLPGIGKTTAIKEYCEILAPEEGGYLFAECGRESGADAIMGINYVNCPDWNSDYDEVQNSVGFKVLIDDIVENKEAEYPKLKVVVVDTLDQLKVIADQEAVRLYNKEAVREGKPKADSVKSAFGGFMRGDDKADDLILDALWSLRKVGVQFVVIGHTKVKDIVDPVTEAGYSQLTTDMSMRTFNKVKNKLDILGVATIDRELTDTKKKKKGNDTVEIGTVAAINRKITFRDDNYAIDSKSRFADITPEIPLSGKALVTAIKDAIEAEITSKGSTVEAVAKEEAGTRKAKEAAAKKASEDARKGKVDLERNEALKEEIQGKYLDASTETKDKVKAYMDANKIVSFKDVSDIPTLCLEEINRMVS